MQENKPILIVGLGNPGDKYSATRHNVGFMAIDHLAGGDATWKREKNALVTTVKVGVQKVLLVKPQTYMNNSGSAVLALMTFYKIPRENLIVIHDEMDLPVGEMREKIGGGSAGHNGIKSIDGVVGREYMRVRIGVGHPRAAGLQMDPADWVLGKFTPKEKTAIDAVIESIQIID
ncbi:aminoacyl-tRNA hydrolase [Lachnospiraceae bacterium OttesenSCG-928-E19]|nr:aminoacyl-tRNA hydrolase [Lachnospiraceae bacterium OttesenSCG-928-E19]